jgi:hypothetical protein
VFEGGGIRYRYTAHSEYTSLGRRVMGMKDDYSQRTVEQDHSGALDKQPEQGLESKGSRSVEMWLIRGQRQGVVVLLRTVGVKTIRQ